MFSWTTLMQIGLAITSMSCLIACQGTGPTAPALAQPDSSLVYDILIGNGLVIDGSGEQAEYSDVLIHADSIAFIGKVDTADIRHHRRIDAKGLVVSPGFIDLHGHGDPMQSSAFENFLAMGVTSIVLGQDGSSPIHQTDINPVDYLQNLANTDLLINIAMLSGHGSLRRLTGVGSDRPADPQEREKMQNILQHALEAGCWGMSSGLEYVPGMWADSLEMVSLAKIIGKENGILMSHIRSEDVDRIEASIDELSWNTRFCNTHVSHLKVTYGKDTAQAHNILRQMDQISESGHYSMSAEVYPYMASYTGIGIVFPPWAKTPSDFAKAQRDRPDELRSFLSAKITQRNGPEATLFGSGPFAGLTLAQVAQKSQRHHVDILLDMGPFGASGAYFVMHEPLQNVFISHPNIAIGSDGSPTMRHPRGYGSFARIIEKYVPVENGLSLEAAIHKMTGRSAEILGLTDRGLLKVGSKADLLIFDPQEVSENATWSQPHLLSTGFETVLINGLFAVDEGQHKSTSSGRLLLRNAP